MNINHFPAAVTPPHFCLFIFAFSSPPLLPSLLPLYRAATTTTAAWCLAVVGGGEQAKKKVWMGGRVIRWRAYTDAQSDLGQDLNQRNLQAV